MSSAQNTRPGSLGHPKSSTSTTFDTGPSGVSSQGFCLKLNSHPVHVTQSFRKLYSNEILCDCTISALGGSVKAHKLVLSTCSSYFMSIFSSITNPFQYPVIVIKDMPLYDLKMILEFMYKGEVTVQRSNLASVLSSARALEVTGLADIKIASASEDVDSLGDSLTGPASNSSHFIANELIAGKSVIGGTKVDGPRKLSGFNLISNRNKHHQHQQKKKEDGERSGKRSKSQFKSPLDAENEDGPRLKFNSPEREEEDEDEDEVYISNSKKLKVTQCEYESKSVQVASSSDVGRGGGDADGDETCALDDVSESEACDVSDKLHEISSFPSSSSCVLAGQGQRTNKTCKKTGQVHKEILGEMNSGENMARGNVNMDGASSSPSLSLSPSSSSSSSSSSSLPCTITSERMTDTLTKCPSLKTSTGRTTKSDINLTTESRFEVTWTSSATKKDPLNEPHSIASSSTPSQSLTASLKSPSASVGSSKNRKLWSDDEITLLLQIWLEEIKKSWASGGKRHFSVKHLAHLLNCAGLTRDLSQIEGKMKAIKRDFKATISGKALSNVQIRIAPHLEQLKEIAKFEEG